MARYARQIVAPVIGWVHCADQRHRPSAVLAGSQRVIHVNHGKGRRDDHICRLPCDGPAQSRHQRAEIQAAQPVLSGQAQLVSHTRGVQAPPGQPIKHRKAAHANAVQHLCPGWQARLVWINEQLAALRDCGEYRHVVAGMRDKSLGQRLRQPLHPPLEG